MKISLRGVLAGLLGTAVLLILLIASGVFDPKPVGELQKMLPATTLTVDQPGQTIRWLDEPLPAGDFSVRGTAVFQSGNLDSGIGLALGDAEQALVVAVSPLGYVLVRQGDAVLLPWQPWPHVQLEENPNEIWIDVRGREVTVRLNRELLWQGSVDLISHRLGLFAEGFGETAVYTFPAIEIYYHEEYR